MGVNDIQIGGTHYNKNEYQHWDMVDDLDLHYYLGCATKYVSRWQDKNGIQDLRKSIHYIDKFQDKGLEVIEYSDSCLYKLNLYCEQLDAVDRIILKMIVKGQFNDAVVLISELIKDFEFTNRYTKG